VLGPYREPATVAPEQFVRTLAFDEDGDEDELCEDDDAVGGADPLVPLQALRRVPDPFASSRIDAKLAAWRLLACTGVALGLLPALFGALSALLR